MKNTKKRSLLVVALAATMLTIALLFNVATSLVFTKTQANLPQTTLPRTTSIQTASTGTVVLNKEQEAKIFFDFFSSFPERFNSDTTIDSVKQLHDFAYNIYYIVEFSPFGYSIYDGTFTIALEINAAAESPYFGLSENLIYAGPTHYYVRPTLSLITDSEMFVHTVMNKTLMVNNDEKASLIEHSNTLAANIGGAIETRGQVSIMRSTYIETASVNSPTTISGQSTAGFNTTGNCGFVASALLVWYAKMNWGWSQFAPNGFNINLVADIQGNRSGDTWGYDLAYAIDDYSKSCNRKERTECWFIPSNDSIYDRVKENKPVIILGSLTDPTESGKVNHAVVVYRVERQVKTHLFGIKTYSNHRYQAHYGWGTTYNSVWIDHSAISIGSKILFD